MKLIEILHRLIVEQEIQDLDNVVEFPRDNFVLTIDRSKRQLIFSPLMNAVFDSKVRTLLTMLKQNFKVTKIDNLEDENDTKPGDKDDPNLKNVFQVELDPREDFEAVIDFIKQHAGM